MQTIKYVITDEVGIHARPAGLFVKEASKYKSDIKMSSNNREVNAKGLMAIMSLGVKQGMEITLTIEGEDEEVAATNLENFLKENL